MSSPAPAPAPVPAPAPYQPQGQNQTPDSAAIRVDDSKPSFQDHARKVGKGISTGLAKTGKGVWTIGEAFFAFINRGSVVDLAVGIVMGAAFTAIVNSFVNDLITPFIGLIGQKNLENNFLVLRCASNATKSCKGGAGHPYTTILEATTDGAVTWNYGRFISFVINFLIVSIVVFMIVRLYASTVLKVQEKPAPKTKTCTECAEEVSVKAKKCKWCLAVFEVAEVAAKPHPERSSPFGFFSSQR